VADGVGVPVGERDVVGTTDGWGLPLRDASLVGVIRTVGRGVAVGCDVAGAVLGVVVGCGVDGEKAGIC
jgi:hypothetical protein